MGEQHGSAVSFQGCFILHGVGNPVSEASVGAHVAHAMTEAVDKHNSRTQQQAVLAQTAWPAADGKP
jgi:hypothetical protein